jgi:hypothetical protein
MKISFLFCLFPLVDKSDISSYYPFQRNQWHLLFATHTATECRVLGGVLLSSKPYAVRSLYSRIQQKRSKSEHANPINRLPTSDNGCFIALASHLIEQTRNK